jgi:hypothetical protein
MLNRIALGLNLVVLLIVIGERSNLVDGSFVWLVSLPWSSFVTELGALSREPTVPSEAVLAAWLFITGLWLATTVSAWAMDKKKAGLQAFLESTSDNAATASPKVENSAGSRRDPALNQDAPNDQTNAQPFSSAPSAQNRKQDHGISDPALGSLFDDLSRQVGAFTPEARAELDKVQKALAALAQKDSGTASGS